MVGHEQVLAAGLGPGEVGAQGARSSPGLGPGRSATGRWAGPPGATCRRRGTRSRRGRPGAAGAHQGGRAGRLAGAGAGEVPPVALLVARAGPVVGRSGDVEHPRQQPSPRACRSRRSAPRRCRRCTGSRPARRPGPGWPPMIEAATRPEADFGDASPAWLMSPTAARTTAPGTTGTGGVDRGVAGTRATWLGTAPEAPVRARGRRGEAVQDRVRGPGAPAHGGQHTGDQDSHTAAACEQTQSRPPGVSWSIVPECSEGPCWHGNRCRHGGTGQRSLARTSAQRPPPGPAGTVRRPAAGA